MPYEKNMGKVRSQADAEEPPFSHGSLLAPHLSGVESIHENPWVRNLWIHHRSPNKIKVFFEHLTIKPPRSLVFFQSFKGL